MSDGPHVYPFFAEAHLRRGRTVLRPIVRMSIGDASLVITRSSTPEVNTSWQTRRSHTQPESTSAIRQM